MKFGRLLDDTKDMKTFYTKHENAPFNALALDDKIRIIPSNTQIICAVTKSQFEFVWNKGKELDEISRYMPSQYSDENHTTDRMYDSSYVLALICSYLREHRKSWE